MEKTTVSQRVRHSNKSDLDNLPLPPTPLPCLTKLWDSPSRTACQTRDIAVNAHEEEEGKKKVQSQHLFKCYYTYRERFSFRAPVLIMQRMFDYPSEISMNIYASSFVEC